jgi:hypothetical protein
LSRSKKDSSRLACERKTRRALKIQPGSNQSEEKKETHRIVLGRNAIYLTIQSDPKGLSH